jgi:hypothetical protein
MVLFNRLTDNDNEPPLHQLLTITLSLHYHNSIRNCHYLHCLAILELQHSPWKKLYENGDTTSFLHMTGLTRRAFGSLLDYLFDLEEIASCYRCRRPCSLDPDGYLGLLLFYLGSKMQYRHLCLIFGITLPVCSRVISMMLKRMVRLLRDHLFARVKFPDDGKMRDFANMVQRREPMLDDITWMECHFQCNARTNGLARMQYIVGTIATRWLTMCLHTAQTVRFFLQLLTYRELGGREFDGLFFTLG